MNFELVVEVEVIRKLFIRIILLVVYFGGILIVVVLGIFVFIFILIVFSYFGEDVLNNFFVVLLFSMFFLVVDKLCQDVLMWFEFSDIYVKKLIFCLNELSIFLLYWLL